jgi:hypothetical protein
MQQPQTIQVPPALSALPGVIGVGFGLKETGGRLTRIPAWRVYVKQKISSAEIAEDARIPAFTDGFATDVIEYAVTRSSAAPAVTATCIANSKGIPGTLGCIARTLTDQQPVVLSNYHVLFGKGAVENDKVWLVGEASGKRTFDELGKVQLGRVGTVRYRNADFYVDCAISSFAPENLSHKMRRKLDAISRSVTGADDAKTGDAVIKRGAATGETRGIIVDAAYPDVACFEENSFAAHRQLLIRTEDGTPFSREGDSGALVTGNGGRALGLLWGTNTRGEGIACPIGPVLYALHITLDQPQKRSWLRRIFSFQLNN